MSSNLKVTKNDLDLYFGKLDERGRGGFGDVNIYGLKEEFELKSPLSQKRVAVKSIAEENATSAQREIMILTKAIDEPYIVTILGYNEYPFMIIMQCYNDDLTSFAQKRKFGFQEKEILKINKDINYGLKALAKLGIIHRDIKPRNLLIDYLGSDGSNIKDVRVVICDFGCSRMVRVDRMQRGVLCGLTMDWGTDGFMAPEIMLGTEESYGRYTNMVDVWGAGASTFYLGSRGKKPFTGEYLQGLNVDINTDDRRDKEVLAKIHEFVEDAFPRVAKILKEMLRWNPLERRNPDQTIALIEFLEREIEMEPESPELTSSFTMDIQNPEEPTSIGTCYITRRRLVTVGLLFCMTLLAVVIGLSLPKFGALESPNLFTCPNGTTFIADDSKGNQDALWSEVQKNCDACYGREDGCSPGSSMKSFAKGMMDASIRVSCNIHDLCYAYKGRSQEECDNELKSNVEKQSKGGLFQSVVNVIYDGVKVLGKGSYINGQKFAETCKRSKGLNF